MKLFLVSPNLDVYSFKQLASEARKLFDTVIKVLPEEVVVNVDADQGVQVQLGEELFCKNDRLIVRFSSRSHSLFLDQVIKSILYANSEKTILNGRHLKKHGVLSKLGQLVILRNAGVPCVETNYSLIPQPTGFPIVVKEIFENNGLSVRKILTQEQLDEYFHRSNDGEVIVQKLIEKTADYRVVVLEGQVLGMMKKRLNSDGFVTNIHEGGVPEKVEDDKKIVLEDISTKALEALDLDYGGVDIIFDHEMPKVLEINPVPGFSGLESIIDVSVAKLVIKHIFD